jgi:hypothetical protein
VARWGTVAVTLVVKYLPLPWRPRGTPGIRAVISTKTLYFYPFGLLLHNHTIDSDQKRLEDRGRGQGFAAMLSLSLRTSVGMMYEAFHTNLVSLSEERLVFLHCSSWLLQFDLERSTPSASYLHHHQTKNSRSGTKSSADLMVFSCDCFGAPVTMWWCCTSTFTSLR